MCFTDLVKYLGYQILLGPQELFEIFDPEKHSLNSTWESYQYSCAGSACMMMSSGKKLDKVRWQLWSVSAAQTRSREARTDVWRLRRLREEEKLYNYSGDYIPLLLRSRMGGDDAHSVLALPRSKEELNILYILFHCVWPLPLLRSAASCIIHKQTQQGSSVSSPSIILLHWLLIFHLVHIGWIWWNMIFAKYIFHFFFTGRAFIIVNYIIKLLMEF